MDNSKPPRRDIIENYFSFFCNISFNLLLRFCLPCIAFGGSFAIFGLAEL
jgi:hypothetical protein